MADLFRYLGVDNYVVRYLALELRSSEAARLE
jgi:hypothetical protein